VGNPHRVKAFRPFYIDAMLILPEPLHGYCRMPEDAADY
jgi:hypothetical protein